MKRTKIALALSEFSTGERLKVMGWVRTRRDSKGGFSFIEVNDGSCLSSLQVIADNALPNYTSEILQLQTGCSIAAEGTLAASPGKGQRVELQAEAVGKNRRIQ